MVGTTVDLDDGLDLHLPGGVDTLVASEEMGRLHSALAVLIVAPCIAFSSCANDDGVIISALYLDRIFVHHSFDQYWRVLRCHRNVS